MKLPQNCYLVIFTLLALFQTVQGQDMRVSGVIVTDDAQGLGYVDVFLMAVDSSVTGTVTDSTGSFSLTVPQGSYTLTTKTWGYEPYTTQISPQAEIQLGNIVMQIDKDITEVEIRARKPLVVREIDRIRVNVANTILADGDAWEMLRLAPGIMVTQKGDIRMNGKSDIRVMIDGRDLHLSGQDLMNMLSGMSASEVASVEIISNPPASFSASGAGVVNIIMKRDSREGMRGTATSRFKRGIFNKYNAGLSLTAKHKKLYLNGSYDLSMGKRFSQETSDMRFLLPGGGNSFWQEGNALTGRYQKHNYHFYADYNFTKNSTLSFRTDGSVTPYNNTDNDGLTTIRDEMGSLDSSIVNRNLAENSGDFQSYFLGYKQKLKNGFWQVLTDYTRFGSTLSQDINSEFVSPAGASLGRSDFRFDSENKVDILGGQFDLSRPIGKLGLLDAGVKFSAIQTGNALEHFNLLDGLTIRDSVRSNQFDYMERNAAAYLSWRKNWENLQLKVGLRSEYTTLEGQDATGAQTIDNQYVRWFPSLHLQYIPSEKNIWGLTYGTRINRPNYRFLNAFRMYSSPYSYIEGNPFLQPSITRNLELSLVRNNDYFFSVFASHTDNPITQISIQDNDESTLRFFALNQNASMQAGFSANGSWDIAPWWSTYWDVSAYYQHFVFNAPDNGSEVNNSAFAVEPFLWTGFYPGKLDGLSIELQFSYYSPRFQGTFRVDSRSELALGIKKKFFKKRVAASFFLADIFNDNLFVLRSQYSEQDHVYRENPENQYFRFGLSWKIGNQKVKTKKEQKSNTEEKQRL